MKTEELQKARDEAFAEFISKACDLLSAELVLLVFDKALELRAPP